MVGEGGKIAREPVALSVKIENHFYQFNVALLAKAIERSSYTRTKKEKK
jgi:hypothetical protein